MGKTEETEVAPGTYVTTRADLMEDLGDVRPNYQPVTIPPDPIVPDGKGWHLVGATATETHLYWFWVKLDPHTRKCR